MRTPNRITKRVEVVIYAMQNYIDNHCLKNIRISDLARDTGINRKVLEAGFKQLFQVTIKKYYVRRQMEFSKQFLDEGTLTIKEISCKCGYRSQNSYTKAFKKLYNITPTEWRNRIEQVQEK